MTRKGRLFATLLLGTIALLAIVTAAERVRHRNANQDAPPEEGDVEQ